MQCNVGTVFSHKLCTFPPQLFATEELLLAADTKSELAKSFPSIEDPASSNRDDIKYVIDGGMLIHRITWKVGSSFTDICASYVSFLSKYLQCTVVFDGYRNSTKDMAHKAGYFTAPPPPLKNVCQGGGGALAPPWDRNPWESVSVRP